uniref:hypothetical protein n=1 Tax=Caballeronia sp. LjRoot34 TaxID=3342325 RepID=UPI003F4F9465
MTAHQGKNFKCSFIQMSRPGAELLVRRERRQSVLDAVQRRLVADVLCDGCSASSEQFWREPVLQSRQRLPAMLTRVMAHESHLKPVKKLFNRRTVAGHDGRIKFITTRCDRQMLGELTDFFKLAKAGETLVGKCRAANLIDRCKAQRLTNRIQRNAQRTPLLLEPGRVTDVLKFVVFCGRALRCRELQQRATPGVGRRIEAAKKRWARA